jgi:hypothetical protein
MPSIGLCCLKEKFHLLLQIIYAWVFIATCEYQIYSFKDCVAPTASYKPFNKSTELVPMMDEKNRHAFTGV